MPSNNPQTEQQRLHLIALLQQLFQLDQPDLDFGFYKIMHAKATAVSDFLHNDLLKIINDTFGEVDETEIEQAWRAYQNAIKTAQAHLVDDPEQTPPVQAAKKKYEAAKVRDARERDIYEHLCRFFERYYDSGDFLSRRYHARETAGKAAPYAIPYDGREVYLHWANRDQYYIKTSEHLSNFTVDLANAKELQAGVFKQESLKLHCRIVSAAEGEHNNNKANGKTERFFLIHPDQPAVMENGELVLQFEYRPDSEKSGQNGTWQKKCLNDAEDVIMKTLAGMANAASYNEILRMEIGNDDNKRTLLRKYLNQYTQRNTADYFIHKDLGGFLKRELDFYIKNEIMHLDDIAGAEAPQVEDYLSKIKVLRKIAVHLINILTQLEEFQKKLWLKKKFVTETNYCITLDKIPQTFYPEIAANKAQRREWQTLFAIDELDGYSASLSKKFLIANPYLVLDTAFFSSDFKDALLASIQDLDSNLDGLLIHSENFQALGLMQEKYREQVQCVYIDPPYNTNASPIIYKNGYKISSWNSLVQSRLMLGNVLMKEDAILCATIDDFQQNELHAIIQECLGLDALKGTVVIRNNPSGRPVPTGFAIAHEYAIFASKSEQKKISKFPRTTGQIERYKERDEDGTFMWELLRKRGTDSRREDAPKSYFPFYYDGESLRVPKMTWNAERDEWHVTEQKNDNETELWPIDSDGVHRRWRWGIDTAQSKAHTLKVENRNNHYVVYYRYRQPEGSLPTTNWIDSKYSATEHGTGLLKEYFSEYQPFSYPKSLFAVSDCIHIAGGDLPDATILDYFAGSGTTGHAVINLNRADNGKRKYIMVEMGEYFDAVTKPRIQKVVYSEDWKDGKPVSRNGVSHAFKYLRLESYEDTLNNLCLKKDDDRNRALANNDDLRRDYMLKYWLDFETQESQSLLNILRFEDPTNYTLNVKKPGSDEQEERKVDLPETFNWLIGMHVDHADQWRRYSGSFTREPDPELPLDSTTRLILDGAMEESSNGKWQFRKIEGRVCRTPGNMEDTNRVLVIWRNLTENVEEDNVMLDEWFKQYRESANGSMPDVIYVNGSNNLPLLRADNEHWKVCSTEHTFHKQMWNGKE